MAGIYKAEQSNLIGYVKAYNQGSADEQMKWVKENKTCFCESCVEVLAKDYLVYIKPISESHITAQTLSGGVRPVSKFVKGGLNANQVRDDGMLQSLF